MRLCAHLEERLDIISSNNTWIRRGELSNEDSMMLVVTFSLLGHKELGFLVMEDNVVVFPKLVSVLQATSVAFSGSLADLVLTIRQSFLASMGPALGDAKSYAQLEACGLLEQCLLAWTVPGRTSANSGFLDDLMGCPYFIRKNFSRNSKVGQVLDGILAKRIGHEHPDPAICTKLSSIPRIAHIAKPREHCALQCFLCSKSTRHMPYGRNLLECARCRAALYCSKECQREGWKTHKKDCKRNAKKTDYTSLMRLTGGFCEKNYIAVMEGLGNKIESKGHKLQDLALVLDFKSADDHGVAPALRGDFKVVASRCVYEVNSPPDELNWMQNDFSVDEYTKIAGRIRELAKKNAESLEHQHMLTIIRKASGMIFPGTLQMHHPEMNEAMFSEICAKAFEGLACIAADTRLGIHCPVFDLPEEERLSVDACFT